MNLAEYKAEHFLWTVEDRVARLTLNRPEKKNPLTFESYAEMRDLFFALEHGDSVRTIVIAGEGENFCSGGDVNEIIGPLVRMTSSERLIFTRMTGDLIKGIRSCPQTVIAAIDGVCVGAGAVIALASDMRIGTERSSVAFLFPKVGLAGCDMGSCAMLPRVIGHGRAAELLFTARSMKGQEALDWGFYSRLVEPDALMMTAHELATKIATGPMFAHRMTKKMLNQEWNMGLFEALEAEAQAQAICMNTNDFERAYNAFVKKEKPEFKGD
ncbi:MAG: enoyl-CoA hydratase family protein [Planctomycetes bacterium]|nr:enoyl-CoA hydratase family protein [Planctomycetota bacterium]